MPRTFLIAVVAVLLSAAAFFFGTGLQPIWWMVWVAPLPVLLASVELSRRSAFLVAFVALFLGGLNMWGYLRHLIGVPLGIALISTVLPAIAFGFVVLLTRAFLVRGQLWLAAFGMPSAWVACEYLIAKASPHSTFGNIAYTQMDFLPIVQIASIAGIWAISFVVVLIPASLAAVFSEQKSHHRNALATTVGLIVVATLGFGAWRLHPSAPQNSLKVSLVAHDTRGPGFPEDDASSLALLNEYAAELRKLETLGSRVFVLPEKIARVSQAAMPQVDTLFTSTAASLRASIVVGLVQHTPNGDFNESRLYSPFGLQAVYRKHHLIPGVERELPGATRALVREQPGPWGLTICKDMDFPRLSREYAADGAVVLFVPAWDFRRDGWLHSRMAILRGIEDGFAIVRTARDGQLTISDSRGRVLAEAASSSAPFAVLTATLPTSRQSTFYSRTGDWFGLFSLIAFLAILPRAFRSAAS